MTPCPLDRNGKLAIAEGAGQSRARDGRGGLGRRPRPATGQGVLGASVGLYGPRRFFLPRLRWRKPRQGGRPLTAPPLDDDAPGASREEQGHDPKRTGRLA